MGLFFPEKLYKVEIRAPTDERILDFLFELKQFHLSEEASNKEINEKLESLSSSLRSMDIILRKLNLPLEKGSSISDMLKGTKSKPLPVPKDLDKSIEKFSILQSQVEQDLNSIQELAYLSKEKEQLHKIIRDAHELIMFTMDFSKLETLHYVKWTLVEVDAQDSEALEAELKKSGLVAIKNTMPEQHAYGYLIFADSAKALDKVTRYVKNVREIPGMSGIPKETLRQGQQRLDQVLAKIKDLTKKKSTIAQKHSPNLYSIREHFVISKTRLELLQSFPKDDGQSIIRGFLPKRSLQKTQKKLREVFSDSATISAQDADEDAPTFLNTPGPLKAFESFVGLYGVPKPYQLNPVPFFAISFLLFFGLMFPDLGDAGIVFLAGLILAIKAPKGSGLKQMAMAVCFMAFSGMFFAVMFGEVFAVEFHEIFHDYKPIMHNAFEDPVGFLALALGIGALHVTLGYLLGMINHGIEKFRNRKYFDMFISGQLGYLLIISSIALLGYASFMKINLHWSYPTFLAGLGIATLVKAEGVIALTEITKIVSNFFSYARILAYNMAHVGVGKAFLSIAGLAAGSGNIFGWIIAALVLVLSHAISIGIAGLGSLVHDLRLHFVEFFPKFYMGEGKVYKPLTEVRQWSVIDSAA